MKNLFEAAAAEEIRARLMQLRPDSKRQWGKMNTAQVLSHCCSAIGMAEGEISPPRILIERLLGPLAKKSMIVNGKPMRRNAMTEKSCVVADERELRGGEATAVAIPRLLGGFESGREKH
jgi:hypothetical protein